MLLQLLLKGASEHGAKRIRVHVLTDGRDVLDGSSVRFVEMLEEDLARLRDKGVDARIASGGGRMYVTMDRYEVLLLTWSVGLLARSIENNDQLLRLPSNFEKKKRDFHNYDRIQTRRNNLQNM